VRYAVRRACGLWCVCGFVEFSLENEARWLRCVSAVARVSCVFTSVVLVAIGRRLLKVVALSGVESGGFNDLASSQEASNTLYAISCASWRPYLVNLPPRSNAPDREPGQDRLAVCNSDCSAVQNRVLALVNPC